MGAPDASPPAQTAEESTSAEDRETRHGTDESHATSAMVQLAGAVIGALGTGVGILAIVALFGGLKMLARLRAAGLPGTEGMANMPRGLLVAVGADELIPVVLFATVAALAVWDGRAAPTHNPRIDVNST